MEQNYYPPPPAHEQQYTNQPPQYYPPPTQEYHNMSYMETAEQPLNANDKIRPSSGFKDIWASILWLCNFAAFIGLSVVSLNSYSRNKQSYGGTQPQQGGGITFDTDTVKIFGFAAIIGFGLSFLYLIVANM